MSEILVIYFSETGNTEKMAHSVAEGVKAEGVAVEVKKVADASVDELLDTKGIIIGSPNLFRCYGSSGQVFPGREC